MPGLQGFENMLNYSGRFGVISPSSTLTNAAVEEQAMAKRIVRPIRIEGNIAYVPLTKGYEAIIDAADVHLVDDKNWNAWADPKQPKMRYAVSNAKVSGRKTIVKMHRVIMKAQAGVCIDHINGETMDNRRSNLRIATRMQSQWNRGPQGGNTSGHKGAWFHRKRQKWVAEIKVAHKKHWLGYFDTAQEAGAAYQVAAAKMHGEFLRVS